MNWEKCQTNLCVNLETVLNHNHFPDSSGDGANDVSMIQAADVGIGISGQEGMQVRIIMAMYFFFNLATTAKTLIIHVQNLQEAV